MFGGLMSRTPAHWSDPREEGPRLSRIMAALQRHADESVVFVLAKSGNDNVVVYRARGTSVVPSWLSLERGATQPTSAITEPLTQLEALGFGCRTTVETDGSVRVHMSAPQLAGMDIRLVTLGDGTLALLTPLGEDVCQLQYGYVQMKRISSLPVVPEAEYVHLYGVDASGAERKHRIDNRDGMSDTFKSVIMSMMSRG